MKQSNLGESAADCDPKELTMAALILGDRSSEPLYLLYLHNDDCVPITGRDGKLLLCLRQENCHMILADAGLLGRLGAGIPSSPGIALDISHAVEMIGSHDIDEESSVLNVLNSITDCLESVGSHLPAHYKTPLWALADHLTFERGISSFFERADASREHVIDAIHWAIGNLALRARVVDVGPAEQGTGQLPKS